jgi:hypothetical protein
MPTRQRDYQRFIAILQDATQAIDDDYFKLPIDGDIPIYRERVYCYELYHHLRCRWPNAREFDYHLGGEVDKAGHKVMKALGAQGIPDILVHGPGYMANNLIIIEVKPAKHITAKSAAIDLQKLNQFVSPTGAGYEAGVYLTYGGNKGDLANVREFGKLWAAGAPGTRLLERAQLFWHARPGERAEPVGW